MQFNGTVSGTGFTTAAANAAPVQSVNGAIGNIEGMLSSGSVSKLYIATTWTIYDMRLHIALSTTGTSFSYMTNNPVGSGTSSAFRDASIRKLADGYWYIAFCGRADGTGSLTPVIRSNDLVNWSDVTNIDFSDVGTINDNWAPQLYQDPSDQTYAGLHVFNNISTDGGTTFKTYEKHPTNASLTAWSPAVQVTGSGLPATYIDSAFYKIGSTYWWIYKNQVGNVGLIETATSSSLTSGYVVNHSGDWMGIGSSVEGPCLAPNVAGNGYYLYVDGYSSLSLATRGIQVVPLNSSLSATTGAIQFWGTSLEAKHCDVIVETDTTAIRKILSTVVSDGKGTPQSANGIYVARKIVAGGVDNQFSTRLPNNYAQLEVGGPDDAATYIQMRGMGPKVLLFDKDNDGQDVFLTRQATGGTDYGRFIGGTNNAEWYGTHTFDIGAKIGTNGTTINAFVSGTATLTSGSAWVVDSNIAAGSGPTLVGLGTTNAGYLSVALASGSMQIISSNASDARSVRWSIQN
jgi:hypothetical protein